MKNLFLVFFIAVCSVTISHSQSVEDIINAVSNANLQVSVAELSGEQAAIIGGTPQTIVSRVYNENDLAANYIAERLAELPNLEVSVQNFNTSGKNIIGIQWGETNPGDIYMICAHYDSVTTYCADDNATGVAAVMEIARILSNYSTDNTIIYALWDEEEIGLRGSNFYAEQAADSSNGNTRDNILGVINMDMIGYDGDAAGTAGDNQFDIDVRDFANSLTIKDDLLNLLDTYTFDLEPIVVNPGTSASDHSRFWNQDYSAVLVGESWETNDQTPDYHSSGDRADDLDFQYMTELTKLVASYVASKAVLIPSLSEDEFAISEIKLFPNPVASIINIKNRLGLALNISINGISGKQISTTTSEKANIEIDVENESAGIYFVTISSAFKTSTFKVVKE